MQERIFPLGGGYSFCAGAFKYFYAFHVPLFFFCCRNDISATLLVRVYYKKSQRLLVPYFFFGGVSIIVYSFFIRGFSTVLKTSSTTTYYEHQADVVSVGGQILNLCMGGGVHLGFVANSVLWFIPALLAVETMGQIFVRVTRRRWIWAVSIAFFLILRFVVRIPTLPWGGADSEILSSICSWGSFWRTQTSWRPTAFAFRWDSV